mmetsp:Transcript_32211/g.54266  ORF Transcript_32211/g.54266 Transcript_32211/m.54266 type:complete len:134 (+) Transcript_32211:57-458(+)
MGRKLRIGLLGLGDMGKVHARTLSRLPNVELTIASRRADVAKEIAEKYNIKNYVTNYDDVFKNPEIDAVVVATAVLLFFCHVSFWFPPLSNCQVVVHRTRRAHYKGGTSRKGYLDRKAHCFLEGGCEQCAQCR